MQSTIAGSHSKQADSHLKRPHHVIPRSPLLIRYQTSDQHVGKQKDNDWQMFETAACQENSKQPSVSANHPKKKERMLHCMHGKTSCLLIHHRAAELKQDVISLTFLPVVNQKATCGLSSVFLPQAVLHTEEEGCGHVTDCQPLWPLHRMEPGCPHPEGQTPQEPAVWVSSKTTTHFILKIITTCG